MNVGELMTKPAVTCGKNDTLANAAQLMLEHDCGAVPITDDAGKLAGILTDRDICLATFTRGSAPQSIAISDVMRHEVFSCREDHSIEDAERLMSDRKVRRVPVVDGDGKPIGLLSVDDIACYAAKEHNGVDREVVETLAAICGSQGAGSAQASSAAGSSPPA